MAQASAEKFKHTGPAEKERVASVPQREQLARTPEPPLPKRKGTEPSVQSTRSWGGGERVKVGESRTLARKRGITAGAWSGKGGLHREGRQITRRKGRASKKSLTRTSRRKHTQVDAKPLQDDVQSLGFTPSLAKPETGKEVGRRRARSYDKRVK